MKHLSEALEIRELMISKIKASCMQSGASYEDALQEFPELSEYLDLEVLSHDIEKGVQNGFPATFQLELAKRLILNR